MICGDTCFAYEKPAASHQLIVAVDPDIEFCRDSSRERVACMDSMSRPRLAVAKRRVRRKTLGGGISSGAAASGPK